MRPARAGFQQLVEAYCDATGAGDLVETAISNRRRMLGFLAGWLADRGRSSPAATRRIGRRRGPAVPVSQGASTVVVVSITVEVPEPLAGRLAAEAARRGLRPEELAVEAIEGRYGHTAPAEPGPDVRDALDAFIGCGASGDPGWASTDVHELRRQAAARKLADGV